MAGRVYEIELVVLPVRALVSEADGLRLDGDAALSFEVHAVEQLLNHFTLINCAGLLHEAVGERGFAMIYMGDDAEVADVLCVHRFILAFVRTMVYL